MAPEGGLSPALSFTGSGGEAGATVQGAGGVFAIKAPPLQEAGYGLTLDLDRDGSFGGGRDVELSGTLSNGGVAVAWEGRDSTGALVPCGVSYPFQATSTLPAMHIVQSDTSTEAGIQIERLSLPADPLLGNPLAASYNDVDPYKGSAVTNTAPSAVSGGTSGPTFHGWSAGTGHEDFTDTWAASHPVNGTGTFEVRCPIASGPPTGNPPASNPPSQPSAPKKHKHHPKPKGQPKLVVQKVASAGFARPSSVISYRITVSNKGDGDARNVKVCDDPPAEQETLRTEPTAVSKTAPCWHLDRLAAGQERVFRLTAEVEPGSGEGMQRNRAVVSAANVKGVRADSAGVRVKPLPESACGSRLARPGLVPRFDFRC
jgi:uncharacterized repeat protein (TIGR01451 family)